MGRAAAAGLYRPRHPERTVLYRVLEEDFERYLLVYSEDYERRSGLLRPVVPRSVYA